MERALRSPVRGFGRVVDSAIEFLRDHYVWIICLVVAYVLGTQIVSPQTRVIKAAGGLFLVLLLLLAKPSFGLGFFIIMFPFPVYTHYGSTNVMIVFLMALFFALRVSSGELRSRGKTMVDGFLIAMGIMCVVSLYNAPDPRWLREGVLNLFFYFSAFTIMYLTYNVVNDERDLQRVTLAVVIMSLLVFLSVLVEVYFPYATIIPGWIGVTASYGFESSRRMAGVVGGHDVLADICVLAFPLILFRLYRARTMTRRFFYVGVALLDLFSLVSTANRGGFVGLIFSMAYLLWITRREFRIVRYTLLFLALVAIIPFFDAYVSAHHGDSLLKRVEGTKIHSNLVPDTRVGVWEGAVKAIKEHPFLGHGLYFDYSVIPQPHNGFLWSLVTIGAIGTLPYVAMLIKLLAASGKRLRGNMERGDFTSGLLSVLHVQIATFIVVQLRTDYQRSPSYVYLMWVIFGLTLVCMRILDRGEERAPERAG